MNSVSPSIFGLCNYIFTEWWGRISKLPTIHQVASLSVRNSVLIVLVVRWSLRLCAISPQFGVAAYLSGLKDGTRLQMVA